MESSSDMFGHEADAFGMRSVCSGCVPDSSGCVRDFEAACRQCAVLCGSADRRIGTYLELLISANTRMTFHLLDGTHQLRKAAQVSTTPQLGDHIINIDAELILHTLAR
jgi:hypothetical protein